MFVGKWGRLVHNPSFSNDNPDNVFKKYINDNFYETYHCFIRKNKKSFM
jgi:hypothetical protein